MFSYRLSIVISLVLFNVQGYGQTNSEVSDAKTIYIVGYQKLFSKHYNGWNISYKEVKDTLNVFTIPVGFSFGKRSLKESSLQEMELESLDNLSAGFGFNGYEQLIEGFFLNLGIGTNIGAEFSKPLASDKSSNFFISGNSKIGFLWVPSKELGITIGSSIFGSLSNSRFIKRDWGVNVEIGINF
jgi:hypothetical protein